MIKASRPYFSGTIAGTAAAGFFKETRLGKYRRITMSPTLWIQRYGTDTARPPSTSRGFVSPTNRPSTAPFSTSTTRLFTFPRKTPEFV